jgi:hypothetical protein
MFHRRASTSALGYPESHPPPPSPFQRTQSVPTSTSISYFHEKVTKPSRGHSFTVLGDHNDDYDDKYGKVVVHRQVLFWRILPCLVIMLLPWIPCQQTRSQISSRKYAIALMLQEQKEMVDLLDETTAAIKELREDIEILSKDNELSFQQIHRNGKDIAIDMESEQYSDIEKEEEGLVTRIKRLEKAIQTNSENRLMERYGDECTGRVRKSMYAHLILSLSPPPSCEM